MERDITFGDKSVFAIEVGDISAAKDFGHIRIWLKNDYIGAFDEQQVLGIIVYQMRRLLDSKTNFTWDISRNLKEAFEMLQNMETGELMVSFGEAFDDFSIFAWKERTNLKFLLRLDIDPFFEYANYGHDFKSAEVPVHFIDEVLSEFVTYMGV